MKTRPAYLKDPAWRAALTCLLLALVAASVFWKPKQVAAQAGVEVESTAAYVFGGQITFTAQVTSQAVIQQATIVILDETLGVSHVRPVTFNAGHSEFLFDTAQNHIRPFTALRWYYQITLSDGTAVQSAQQTLRYEDNRYQWQTLEAGALRLLWAQGDAAFGQNALNAALTGLENISNLLPVEFSQPIDLYIYPTQNEIAQLTGEPWEIGRAYPDLGIALIAAPFDANQNVNFERRIPHELMHIFLYRQVGSGYQNLPVWLNEGYATLAETNPTPDYAQVLADHSDRNALIPMRDLCASFPADPAVAFLAYAQARSFTTYLRDTYGSPALLNLARVYATGMDCETGIQGALGLSLSELDANWREQTLGQNALGAALRNMLPYLILFLLVLVVPIMVGLNASRQKGDKHAPEKFTRKR